MRSKVFNDVAGEGDQCPGGYDAAMHERVDGLVQEWIDLTGGYAYGGKDSLKDSVKRCQKWVKARYVERYSNEPEHQVYGFALTAFILLAIIGGAISWYVQRTLDRWYPRS